MGIQAHAVPPEVAERLDEAARHQSAGYEEIARISLGAAGLLHLVD
jgi:hypothetical protein